MEGERLAVEQGTFVGDRPVAQSLMRTHLDAVREHLLDVEGERTDAAD